jgi:hypothetical protein
LTGPIIGIRALSYNGNQQRKNWKFRSCAWRTLR